MSVSVRRLGRRGCAEHEGVVERDDEEFELVGSTKLPARGGRGRRPSAGTVRRACGRARPPRPGSSVVSEDREQARSPSPWSAPQAACLESATSTWAQVTGDLSGAGSRPRRSQRPRSAPRLRSEAARWRRGVARADAAANITRTWRSPSPASRPGRSRTSISRRRTTRGRSRARPGMSGRPGTDGRRFRR
jgi:hypothetical protein